jgi:hypothetical protein
MPLTTPGIFTPSKNGLRPSRPFIQTISFFLWLLLCLLPISSQASWVQDGGSLSNGGYLASPPALAYDNGTVYAAWREENTGGGSTTSFSLLEKHWNGTGWVQDSAYAATVYDLDAFPTLAVNNGNPYIAWYEPGPSGTYQINVEHWDNGTWVKNGPPFSSTTYAASTYPVINFAGNVPYVAWHEIYHIYLNHWNGSAWVNDGGAINDDTPGSQGYPSGPDLAIGNSMPYVAWTEYAGGPITSKLFVKHWNGTTWEHDGGSLNFDNAAGVSSFHLTMNNNVPYLAWCEDNNLYSAHWDGTRWLYDTRHPKPEGFLGCDVSNGTPHMAYQTNGHV